MTLSLEMLEEWPLYGPAEGTHLPGVVILHGSEGPMAGWAHRFAAILAAHGFLALPYGYGTGTLWAAGPIREVPLEGVLAAVAALAAHPRCRGAGLFGWSRGGEAAVLLASLHGRTDGLPAVAAHAPSDVVNPAYQAEGAAWTWRGAPLAPGQPIAIEAYPGPLFLSVGDADAIWDPDMTRRLAARHARTDLMIAEGQGHGYDFATEPQLWARLFPFFRKHLK